MFTSPPVSAATRVLRRVLARWRRADEVRAVVDPPGPSPRFAGTMPSAKWLALG